jgi:diguanylate cyclase (GGDEF)-like protein
MKFECNMNEINVRNSKILIVDDVPVNIKLQRTYLTAVGYEVAAAKDGVEALEQVKVEQPDLILLDVMMPKMNGFQVCQKLKNSDETRFIPIIMVTALNELEDKIKGIEAGADDFICKPYNKLELLARVKSLLRIKHLHDQLEEKLKELEVAHEQLRQLAITDGLTGLYNFRYFKEQLTQELNRARRHKARVSVAIMDIDYFKHYNDTHGHPAGNVVLTIIAELLKNNIRNIDVAARYGGEEFSLILAESDKSVAACVAHKIKKLVEDYPFQYQETQPNKNLTISMGVATFPDDGFDPDELVKCADQRLYRAKQNGRNLVIID